MEQWQFISWVRAACASAFDLAHCTRLPHLLAPQTFCRAPFILLSSWLGQVMQWHDGRFMRHTRFRYWALNTWLRMETPKCREVFLRRMPGAQEVTLKDLQDPAARKKIVQQMATVARAIPGSVGERRHMRQLLEAMVDQIEAETADRGENGGRGRMPAGFCALTSAIYKWPQLFNIILRSYSAEEREEFLSFDAPGLPPDKKNEMRQQAFYTAASRNPGVVAWYCAVRLEMAVKLTVALLGRALAGDVVPGEEETIARFQTELRHSLGDSTAVVDISPP